MFKKKKREKYSGHLSEQVTDDVEQLIIRTADTVHQEATKTAKSKFAEMMKSVQKENLSPEELELYYDAFADLTRSPDQLREFVLKELEHHIEQKEQENVESIVIIEGTVLPNKVENDLDVPSQDSKDILERQDTSMP